MSFNYQKNKEHSSDSFWTSYSDLFLGLSTIFLLLYVTSSLRTGTDALRGQIENKKLSMKVEELEQQLKMYESVKDDYLAKQAPKNEVQEYQELMDKLTLLSEDAKTERERLMEEALANGKKVKALNKYQQMVRNILNSNKMAKSKIINRDDLIKDQDVEIAAQETQITDLNKDIQNKKNLILQGENKIAATQEELKKSLKELQTSYKKNKLSKKSFEKKMAKLKAENAQRVSQLSNTNAIYQSQLNQANEKLGQIQGELSTTQGLLSDKEAEANQLAGTLSKTKAEASAKIAGLESDIVEERSRGSQKVAALQKGFAAEKEALQGALSSTQGQLAKARAEIEARKSIADEIRKGFGKAGIKADIDLQTGDVVLDFGQTYFDNNSDKLKREMKGVLEKAMPIYSKSLLGNPKLADKISAVEIIGFASPTYQGRYVDPRSSRPEDKAALKYNMDLSYRRANAIFSYMLDEGNMRFEHQRELLSLMKVSGRSFLEVMKVQNRNVATAADFCRLNDCKKAQRVIIRFNMDPKK